MKVADILERLRQYDEGIRVRQTEGFYLVLGRKAKLLRNARGQHSGTRHKAGKIFSIAHLFLEGRGMGDISVWLAKVETPHLFELAVNLNDIEILEKEDADTNGKGSTLGDFISKRGKRSARTVTNVP